MERIPLARPYLDEEMKQAALRVLESKRWVKGPQARIFGQAFAEYCGALVGIPCMNGSAALIAALRLLEIGSGDEIIVPSLTFISSATCVDLVGATPVFCDVEADYWCLDPTHLRSLISTDTKAIIAVHLFGQVCHPDVFKIGAEFGIPVIEDAAQAHGGKMNGKTVGNLGTLACFSFFPSKNMAVGGEGGMVTTSDPELGIRLQQIVDHGRTDPRTAIALGTNLRMGEVNAAIGLTQLSHLTNWQSRRRWIASQYLFGLEENPHLTLPAIRSGSEHAWHQFCILVADPRGLIDHLGNNGVDATVHYPIPCHRQPIYAGHHQHLGTGLERSEELGPNLVAIPIHPHLTDEEVKHIIAVMRGYSR